MYQGKPDQLGPHRAGREARGVRVPSRSNLMPCSRACRASRADVRGQIPGSPSRAALSAPRPAPSRSLGVMAGCGPLWRRGGGYSISAVAVKVVMMRAHHSGALASSRAFSVEMCPGLAPRFVRIESARAGTRGLAGDAVIQPATVAPALPVGLARRRSPGPRDRGRRRRRAASPHAAGRRRRSCSRPGPVV
jgi:hypothetical protein